MRHDHSPASGQTKLPFLDGIRGLMALSVVISHFTVVFFPQMQLQAFAGSEGGCLSLFAKTPLSVLVNGNIAVQYFFVLTGFLVARTFFTRSVDHEQIIQRCVNRYLRLLPIVLAATAFTALTMCLGLQYHLKINDLLINRDFLPYYCNFRPTVGNFLVNTFVYPFIRNSAYVGPFWTIHYEFFGYILAMVICHLFRESRFRRLGYLVSAVLCFSQLNPNYAPFVFGVFVGDLKYNDRPDILDGILGRLIGKPFVTFAALVIGGYFACCPLYYATIYAPLRHLPKVTPDLIRAVGAAMVLYALLHLPRVQKFCSNKLFLFLGRISYPVYAIHWPIMLSLQCWLFSVLIGPCSYAAAAVISFLLTLPVIYGAAYLMWRTLERDHPLDLASIARKAHRKERI